jgi:16S rRNA processing protein RimM
MALLGYRDLLTEDGAPALSLQSARPVKDGIIVRTPQVTTKEAADALRGTRLFIPREALPEPDEEDDYYVTDLIGLAARSPEGERMGKVKWVHDYGAGDILEIDPGNGRSTWMQPFTREAVPEVKIAEGYVVLVRLPETGDEQGRGITDEDEGEEA